MDLSELRLGINEIDKELLELFEKRMNLCFQVAEYKIENNLPVFQSAREKEILDRVSSQTSEELAGGARVFFQTLMDISKCKQYQKFFADKNEITYEKLDLTGERVVAIPGTSGSYSHIAAGQIFEGLSPVFYEEFSDVFKAVEEGKAEFGIVPIANSTAGTVSATYELLRKFDLKICGTTKVKVSHCLAARKGIGISDIKIVYSHEQALSQCSHFISDHSFKAHKYTNTATAACYVAQSDEPFGAICSEECAEEQGLEILCRDIANVTENYTKFILISKKILRSENANIISVCLALPHTSSALYRLLTKFSVAGLNLLMIESRPIANTDFDAFFYLDFVGAINSPEVAMLMNELESELSYFQFLGNYEEL
ncbi:MAG: bifunctional chorismate mutase/prephenate dehydratase [Hominimerdicola sp.]